MTTPVAAPSVGSRDGAGHACGGVVVSYNARSHLLECLESLRAEGVAPVVVVDNGSRDGAPEAARDVGPPVSVVETGRNLGYGAAANVGVARLDSEHVLVTNPDVVFHPGAVAALVAALEADPGLAAVGPRIEDAEGHLYPSARTFPGILDALGHAFLGLVWPSNPFSRRYKLLDWDHAEQRTVDWISGACLVVRRSAFRAVGGFDPAYFMYSEDVDLCWRLARAGWRVAYVPAAGVVHHQGRSSAGHPYRMAVAHHVSLLRFAARSSSGWQRGLLPVVGVGLGVRAAVVVAQRAWARRTLR